MKLNKENKVKKDFGDNHRTNYLTYNKSNIFHTQGDNGKVSAVEKGDKIKTLEKTKTKSNFVPRFREETAFNRKLKEFWNKEEYVKDYGTVTTSKGFLEKEEGQNNKRQISVVTPSERRILDMHPNATEESVRTMTRAKSFYEKNSYSEKKSTDLTAKAKRTTDMYSNIFHDPDKTEENTLKRNRSVFIKRDVLKALDEADESNKKKRYEKTPYKNYNKTKSKVGLGTKANALNINTELVERRAKNSEETYSASDMKRKHLVSTYSEGVKKKFCEPVTPKTKKEESKASEVIMEKFGSSSRSQKLTSLASSFQSKEFYSQSYSKSDKQDRPTENYEIVTKSGFDKIEPKELKYLFTRKGIHIYDFEEKGKYHDGFKSGNISFKIRKNEDPKFKEKLTEINKKITNLGMKLVNVPINTKRPKTELVPNGVEWHDTQMNKITNGRIEKISSTPNLKKLQPADKLSNHVIQTDSAYKNPYSHKQGMFTSKSGKKI